MERYQEIERSLIKTFRKDIWRKFVKAVVEYELIKENDRIMVCISGGKDSFVLAKCIQEIQRHGKFHFEAHYVCMNPGYTQENYNLIVENAKTMGIPLEVYDSDIFDIVERQDRSPCYLCAKMRRGCLYSKAQSLGCNKIALGHHMDDVVETTLLSMFYGAELKTMMPKLHSENFPGMELIRPLYWVREASIIDFAKVNQLRFLNCACKLTAKAAIDESASKRKEIKRLIQTLMKTNKNLDYNIFKAMDNVNLNCVLGTKKNGVYHSFLEDYEEE